MRQIIVLAFMSLACLTVNAQLPQYSNYNPTGRLSQTFEGFRSSLFLQAIYHPADFPSAPAGRMTNIYFHIAQLRYTRQGTSIVYYGWRARIGNTSLDTFKGRVDTAIQELMTIMEVDSFVVPHSDSAGSWVQIPLGNKVFNFSRTQNFVVEYAFDSSYNGLVLNNSMVVPQKHWRYIVGAKSVPPMVGSSAYEIPPDLGFDIIPVGIKDADNIRSFGLFPNPSNGRFVVSFEARKPVKQVSLTASNMLGQVVFRQEYPAGGTTSFFRELSLGHVPKGMYAVEVVADGERIVRRLQVE